MVTGLEEREMLFFGKQYKFKFLNSTVFKPYPERDVCIEELETAFNELPIHRVLGNGTWESRRVGNKGDWSLPGRYSVGQGPSGLTENGDLAKVGT